MAGRCENVTTTRQHPLPARFRPWRLAFLALLVAVGLAGLLATPSADAQQPAPKASVVTIDDAIQPTSQRFLERSIKEAVSNGSSMLIVQLDTPGGVLDSTRKMVEAILAAPIPVVVYVYPQGAQAASAGTFILAAGHIAAMAPSTNTGAASPVGGSGEDLPETLKSKATEDAAAFLRSIAETRGRNGEALEATVLQAKAYTATEALNLDVVDIIAADVPGLLAQLDGVAIPLAGGDITLDTDGMSVTTIHRTPLEHFLGFLANPNIALLLLSFGSLGIIIELWNFGMLVPGIIGGILLALGLVGLYNLPVNWVAFGLLAFAMALIFLEMQAPGFGIFGVGGIISFVIGAFFLFGDFSFDPAPISSPGFRVSIWLLVVIALLMAGIIALFVRFAAEARKIRYVSGVVTIAGHPGVVVTPLAPRGTVRVDGEMWSAESSTGGNIQQGASVVVEDMSGLTLKVRIAEETSTGQSGQQQEQQHEEAPS
ncbi:MAG: nodulation protein NfeD [SAR202 cluster bacterium]|nr:nodulation protein NfeD [SAR202 cluster bacterium]